MNNFKEPKVGDKPSSRKELSGTEESTEFPASYKEGAPFTNGRTTDDIIHDLQVHQVELEMQAEELRRTRLELEVSRDRYFDLFEFAPLGYLTLNEKAVVIEANLTAATILGIFRNKLVKARFNSFIAEKDYQEWHRYFISVLKQREKQTCTLTLTRGDGSQFPARLESIRMTDIEDAKQTVRIAISDITDIKLIEEALHESENKYHLVVESAEE